MPVWKLSKFWVTYVILNYLSYFESLTFYLCWSPWNLAWMFLLYLFNLKHSSLLAYCSVLSAHGVSVICLLTSECVVMFWTYVFITNMVAKIFLSRQSDWLALRSLRMKSDNWKCKIVATEKAVKHNKYCGIVMVTWC